MNIKGLFCAVAFLLAFPLLMVGQKENQNTGSLKFKVGVVFKNGDVRPVARTDFYVLPKSPDDLLVEAAKAANVNLIEPFDEYIDRQTNLSAELKRFIKKYDLRNTETNPRGGGVTVITSEGKKIIGIDDLRPIPEFATPITRSASFAIWQLDDRLPNMNYMREMTRRRDSLSGAVGQLAFDCAVAKVKTSLSGDAEIPNLPVGRYWLTNLRPTKVGESFILWEVPINIDAGKLTELELSNDNAASKLE